MNKRLARALKFTVVFTVIPHLIFIGGNMVINAYYHMPVTEDILSLYSPLRVAIFGAISAIVFLWFYFSKSKDGEECEDK